MKRIKQISRETCYEIRCRKTVTIYEQNKQNIYKTNKLSKTKQIAKHKLQISTNVQVRIYALPSFCLQLSLLPRIHSFHKFSILFFNLSFYLLHSLLSHFFR